MRALGPAKGAAFSEAGGSRGGCEPPPRPPGAARVAAGGVAQLGERGSIPFTSTTERTMQINVRSKRDSSALAPARAREARPGVERRALLCADRGEADLAIGHDARWRLIFDRVNREYLSSMIGCGGAVTSVIRRQWPVVCSGEECLHARRVARGCRGMIDGRGCLSSVSFGRLSSAFCGACPCERRV